MFYPLREGSCQWLAVGSDDEPHSPAGLERATDKDVGSSPPLPFEMATFKAQRRRDSFLRPVWTPVAELGLDPRSSGPQTMLLPTPGSSW